MREPAPFGHAVFDNVSSSHASRSASGSPTAYRLGSPTRLVRFGFVGETASVVSTNREEVSLSTFLGDLTRVSPSSTTCASVFFSGGNATSPTGARVGAAGGACSCAAVTSVLSMTGIREPLRTGRHAETG